METALNWLRNSLFLGWLLRDWSESRVFQGSIVVRFLARLLAGARSWMKNSYFLGWAADAGGLEVQASRVDLYESSLAVSIWARVRRAFLNLIWALGKTFRQWVEGSFVWRRPLGFLGLIVFFYLAMDIGANQPGWRMVAVKTLIALLALSLTLIRPSRDWWEASLPGRIARWWSGADSRERVEPVTAGKYNVETEGENGSRERVEPIMDDESNTGL